VTDAAVVGAAVAGLQSCAKSNVLRPPDCPQAVASTLYIAQVKWQLVNDPAQGASVSFDGDRDLFSVQGRFAMTVSYLNGGRPATATSQGGYQAQLFWNGSSLVLVAINAR
jgi:hypothetical protein